MAEGHLAESPAPAFPFFYARSAEKNISRGKRPKPPYKQLDKFDYLQYIFLSKASLQLHTTPNAIAVKCSFYLRGVKSTKN